jgi:uncharacterized protein with GYD domain
MATYFMFGSYSEDAIKRISARRTEKAAELIANCGGTLESGYALLGEDDLVLIVDLPGVEQAMQVSVALTKLTGISFTTVPAVPVDTFDKMMEDV